MAGWRRALGGVAITPRGGCHRAGTDLLDGGTIVRRGVGARSGGVLPFGGQRLVQTGPGGCGAGASWRRGVEFERDEVGELGGGNGRDVAGTESRDWRGGDGRGPRRDVGRAQWSRGGGRRFIGWAGPSRGRGGSASWGG